MIDLKDSIISSLDRRDVEELERAIDILVQQGAAEIYLFGSMARGESGPYADWDIAVRGPLKERFFKALGLLLRHLERETDLINLDEGSPFSKYVTGKKELLRIA